MYCFERAQRKRLLCVIAKIEQGILTFGLYARSYIVMQRCAQTTIKHIIITINPLLCTWYVPHEVISSYDVLVNELKWMKLYCKNKCKLINGWGGGGVCVDASNLLNHWYHHYHLEVVANDLV